ncbi:MAG: hypothetical protein ACREMQ_18965 [Longimicrobiales bacterium]
MIQAYEAHLQRTNPLVDHPTVRLLRTILLEEKESQSWGALALSALLTTNEARARAAAWQRHLSRYLAAAGGIAGDGEERNGELPMPRAPTAQLPDMTPRRDARSNGSYDFDFPPRRVRARACTRSRAQPGTSLQAAVGDGCTGNDGIVDYDWADEVLHAQIGRNWLKSAGLLTPDILDRGRTIHERTWSELQKYASTGRGNDWWFRFVQKVLVNRVLLPRRSCAILR